MVIEFKSLLFLCTVREDQMGSSKWSYGNKLLRFAHGLWVHVQLLDVQIVVFYYEPAGRAAGAKK